MVLTLETVEEILWYDLYFRKMKVGFLFNFDSAVSCSEKVHCESEVRGSFS